MSNINSLFYKVRSNETGIIFWDELLTIYVYCQLAFFILVITIYKIHNACTILISIIICFSIFVEIS